MNYEKCISNAIAFSTMLDHNASGFPDNLYPICFTTVQVKTEGMSNGKLKPKTIGHVDIGMSFIKWNARDVWDGPVIRTRSCFASDGF